MSIWSSAKAVHISFPGQLSSLTAKGYRTTTQSETSAGVGMFCLAQNWQNWHERCGCLGKIQNFSSRSHVLTFSRPLHNLKFGQFTSLPSRGRQRNVPKCKTHVQSYCFCSLNPLFCGVLVAIVVVLA